MENTTTATLTPGTRVDVTYHGAELTATVRTVAYKSAGRFARMADDNAVDVYVDLDTPGPVTAHDHTTGYVRDGLCITVGTDGRGQFASVRPAG